MSNTFAALAPEYTRLLGAMVIDPHREAMLKARASVILLKAAAQNWAIVNVATGVPKLWAMASFEREASSNYLRSPAQGDPWNRKSIHVPADRGPFTSWAQAAVDAYRIDRLDKVGAANWTWARACYEGELFNGMGYRSHGIHSPYLWAWTNVYSRGKFTSDGHYDAGEVDQQCGMVPLMIAMLRLDPTLALTDALPDVAAAITPPVAPAPAELGGTLPQDAAWIQASLNALGAKPTLIVDNHYGRATRRSVAAFQRAHHLHVDGLAGPQTIAALAA